MPIALRRMLVAVAVAVLGAMIGSGFDAAGATPHYDGDMTTRGLVAGVALGVAVSVNLRE